MTIKNFIQLFFSTAAPRFSAGNIALSWYDIKTLYNMSINSTTPSNFVNINLPILMIFIDFIIYN